MEKILLVVLLQSVFSQNWIKDGDFQQKNPTAYNDYSGDWYNKNGIGLQFYIGSDSGNKYAELNDAADFICQNTTIQFRSQFRINFDKSKGLTSPSNPSITATVQGSIIFSQAFSSTSFATTTNVRDFEPGVIEICFFRDIAGSTCRIDNVAIDLSVYYETTYYKILEDSQKINSAILQITFLDPLSQKYWTNYDIKSNLMIFMNMVNLTNFTVAKNDQQGIKIQFDLTKQFLPNTSILFGLNYFTVKLASGADIMYTNEKDGEFPHIRFFTDEEKKVLQTTTQILFSLIENLRISLNCWSMVGVTYLISNLFTFSNLIVLYNYLPFKYVLVPYKNILNNALEILLSGGDVNVVLDTIFGVKIEYQPDPNIEEKIGPSTNGIKGMGEHGFSSDFFNNSWDELLNVGLLILKIVIIRALLMLPIRIRKLRKYFKAFRKMEIVYLLYEVIAGAPTIMIPIGFVLGVMGEMGVLNLNSKMNMAVLCVFPFVLFITPFLLLFYELEEERTVDKKKSGRVEAGKQEEKQTQKQKQVEKLVEKDEGSEAGKKSQEKSNVLKEVNSIFDGYSVQEIDLIEKNIAKGKQSAGEEKDETKEKEIKKSSREHSEKKSKRKRKFVSMPAKSPKFNDEQKKCFVTFLENMLLFVIPFLVGIGNVDLFMITSLLLMFLRIAILLRLRSAYTKWELFKEMFNRSTWLLFNLLYLGYYIAEKLHTADTPDAELVVHLKSLGLGSIILIIIGCIGEVVLVLIDLLIWIIEQVKECRNKSNKVQPNPGVQNINKILEVQDKKIHRVSQEYKKQNADFKFDLEDIESKIQMEDKNKEQLTNNNEQFLQMLKNNNKKKIKDPALKILNNL